MEAKLSWQEKQIIMKESKFDYPLEFSGNYNDEFEQYIIEHAWEHYTKNKGITHANKRTTTTV